ncbi:di-heme oxidoredictase family protein, partial [Pseudomonas fluorescens]
MPSLLLRLSALLLALGLSACDDAPRFTEAEPGEARSGGSATVRKTDQNSFSLPSANLSPSRRVDFSVGNSFFRNPWVIAPSTTTARDGLGPLFNTNACQNCHIKDGRGHPPAPDAPNAVSMLVRLSIPDTPAYAKVIEQLGVVPEPVYGGQFQDMAVPGIVPEGKVRVDYMPLPIRFKDGTEVQLRKPTLQITQLGYGPMHPDTRFSARVAPPMIGLGLLEAIPEAAILANAEAQAREKNGIAGRPNRVWDDAQQKTVLGRFGWKAGQPNLNQQNVHAFSGDMGLTTRLRPVDDCTDAQSACQQAPNGN